MSPPPLRKDVDAWPEVVVVDSLESWEYEFFN